MLLAINCDIFIIWDLYLFVLNVIFYSYYNLLEKIDVYVTFLVLFLIDAFNCVNLKCVVFYFYPYWSLNLQWSL